MGALRQIFSSERTRARITTLEAAHHSLLERLSLSPEIHVPFADAFIQGQAAVNNADAIPQYCAHDAMAKATWHAGEGKIELAVAYIFDLGLRTAIAQKYLGRTMDPFTRTIGIPAEDHVLEMTRLATIRDWAEQTAANIMRQGISTVPDRATSEQKCHAEHVPVAA